jgi:hypothetical protein
MLPTGTAWFVGWIIMAGGPAIASRALELVIEPKAFDTSAA